MPPPYAAAPFWIVTFWIVTVPVDSTWNTRSSWPPSMIVVAAVSPEIVTALVRSRSPVAFASSFAPASASVYVPAGTTIVSAPAPVAHASTAVSVFAAWIASRSVQLPSTARLSAVESTVIVAACAAPM